MATTLPATRLPIVVNKNAPGSFYDQITIAGSPISTGGAGIDFSMRPLASRTPAIDKAAGVPLDPPDLDGNNVRYDWNLPSDMAVEGEFFAWWGFTLSGQTRQETPEFPLLISDHGPGLGTQTGAIVDGASMFMPITFAALQKDARYGDRALQRRAELVKMKVLGYTVPADQEEQFDLVLLDFLSKRVALELITPGIDFWSRQLRTATATQTAEVSSFPDMIASLKELRIRLADELTQDWREVQLMVPGTPNRKVVPMPASSLDLDPWYSGPVTRNPQEMPPLRTGWVGWGFDGLGVFPFP